jgi:hypothetical protein
LVADDEIGGEVYTCPTCGNDDYMFMTEREIAAWNRKRGTVLVDIFLKFRHVVY